MSASSLSPARSHNKKKTPTHQGRHRHGRLTKTSGEVHEAETVGAAFGAVGAAVGAAVDSSCRIRIGRKVALRGSSAKICVSVERAGNKKVLYFKSMRVVLSDAPQKSKKVWPRTAEVLVCHYAYCACHAWHTLEPNRLEYELILERTVVNDNLSMERLCSKQSGVKVHVLVCGSFSKRMCHWRYTQKGMKHD